MHFYSGKIKVLVHNFHDMCTLQKTIILPSLTFLLWFVDGFVCLHKKKSQRIWAEEEPSPTDILFWPIVWGDTDEVVPAL